MTVISAPSVKPNVTITLNGVEAAKLRRACNFNKTVAGKFKNSPHGGDRKAEDIDAFLAGLGKSLKGAGVDQY